ncbi:MAG TPA: HD domain-containing phosphohydrolase [Actinomycetota bacterium]|nr:HD domain-containing phosphohydrolase [Actinomycetota bacterium]
MSGQAVPRAAISEAAGFIRAFSTARQTYTLYPPDHPKRVEAVQGALDAVRELRRAMRGDPVLFVARHALYLGPVLLPRVTLSRYALVDALEKAGIRSIEPLQFVSSSDIDKLVQIALGELPRETLLEGLALNRVRAAVDSDDDEEGIPLPGLQRAYAFGLEVLRDTAAAIAADRPVDLAACNRVVQQLSDQIVRDPTQALMLATVRSHDEYTYYHMLNVCLLSIALGYAVGLHQDQILGLGLGALLHDVGKVNVPVDVLQHVGALSVEQWRLVQRHPVEGAAIIFGTGETLLDSTSAIVLEHHAAYDLSGYPSLSGRPHPSLPARMVAVADCFDAVTTTRPYRKAEERRQALNILLAGAGRGYDPRVVRTFVRLLGLFPVGSLVRLTNKAIGVVVRNHDRLLSRPKVQIMLKSNGDPCDPYEVDLSERDSDGSFRWNVERSMDPGEVGLDMVSLVLSGEVEPAAPPKGTSEPGLMHDPGHSEPKPAGYEDFRAEAGASLG